MRGEGVWVACQGGEGRGRFFFHPPPHMNRSEFVLRGKILWRMQGKIFLPDCSSCSICTAPADAPPAPSR